MSDYPVHKIYHATYHRKQTEKSRSWPNLGNAWWNCPGSPRNRFST